MTDAWSPILTGELADRAWAALRELSAALAKHTEPIEDLVAYWSYVAPALGGEADDHHDAALDRLDDVLARGLRGIGLHDGLAGFAWTVAHVTEGSEELLETIERDLIAAVEADDWDGHYDLISGLVGIGVYFLERAPAPLAERGLAAVVRQLARRAEHTDTGITWRTPVDQVPIRSRGRYPNGWYNVGVAHGVPGVIGLLGRLRAPEARALCDGAIAWVLAQTTAEPAASRFPTVAGGSGSRVAWCYGDPGVAAVLFDALARAGKPTIEVEAIVLTALARPLAETAADDSELCHGTAGLAHIANRMFHATRNAAFRDAAVRWFTITLDRAQPGVEVGGFPQLAGLLPTDRAWAPARELLDGAAGVGLALVAALTSVVPRWDRKLLLDLPVSPKP